MSVRVHYFCSVVSYTPEQDVFGVQVVCVGCIVFREFNRVGSHNVIEDFSSVNSRTVVSFKNRSHVHIQHGSFRQVHANVAQQVETVDADVVIETLRFVFFQDTRILVVAGRYIVANHFTATAYVQVIVLVVSEIFKHFVVPVYIRVSVRIQSRNRVGYFLCRVIRGDSRVVVELRFVVQIHVRHPVNRFRNFGRHRETRFMTERYFRSTFHPFLGGNHDNPVSAFGSVQGGSRSIFQHGELFDVIRFDTSQVVSGNFKTVQQNQRALSVTESGNPANEEFGVVFTRFPRTLVRYHPCHTTSERSGQVRRGYFQLFGVDSVD